MPPAGPPFVLAPAITFAALLYAMRPDAGHPPAPTGPGAVGPTTLAVAPVGAVAPTRLAAVRAALATGAYAVLTVEVLGAFGRIDLPAFCLAWAPFVAVALGLAVRRHRRDPWHPDLRVRVRSVRPRGRTERLLFWTVGGLLLAELLVALLAEPNNFDSQTYHLPKVEHWVAQGNLDPWPTAIHRQVTIPPGAEYLLLHLRLATGGDGLYNLVQWCAGLGALLVVTRITAQLGGGRRAQLLSAFVLATTPMVVLQATSTQTDLVVAAWVACLATLVLDGLRGRTRTGSVLAIGAATGLIAVTKTSGLLGAGPLLLLWGGTQLRLATRNMVVRPGRALRDLALPGLAQPGLSLRGRARPATRAGVLGLAALRIVAGGLLAACVAGVITGPFLLRMDAEFGNPLGPPRLRESIPTQRHDPAAILVNGLRIGHTALDTPFEPLRSTSASMIEQFARMMGVDPQDRTITFGRSTFHVESWYPDEDRVAFPLAGTLVLIGGVVALVRPRRVVAVGAPVVRWYAAVLALTLLLHVTMLKWQPWGNRLLLYALVVAVPVAGLWLDAVLPRADAAPAKAGSAEAEPAVRAVGHRVRRPSTAVVAVLAVLATSALAGVLTVSYGYPRRLVGAGSLLTSTDWQTRFLRRPQWADEFRWAADAVRASGAHRIGLVQQNDTWEYPWWLLLRDYRPDQASRDGAGRRDLPGNRPGQRGRGGWELVALQSVLPKRPPADPRTVDAIVCTGERAVCARYVPTGWRLEFRDYVGYALPSR